VRQTLISTVVPAAVEVDLPGPDGTLAVLLEGSYGGVAARCDALCRLLGDGSRRVDTPPPWWGAYPFGAGDVALRVSTGITALPSAIGVLRTAAGSDVPVRGSAGTGVVYAALPADQPKLSTVVTATRSAITGTVVILAAPDGVRDGLDLWGPVPGLGLMQRVKQQFDPAGRFVSGRFVGGI
jgi:glycolate oxidase FAD binding subunit